MVEKRNLPRGAASAVVLCAIGLFAPPATGDKAAPPGKSDNKSPKALTFKPGTEVKVMDRGAGELGYYKVYVPKEYTRDRAWPVIFCYHGLNGKPTTGTFRSVLAGKHYIIVGMGYYKRGKGGYAYLRTKDIQILGRVLRTLRNKLRINPKRLLAGGFSKGAYYAAGLFNVTPGTWAGAAVLAGGMNYVTRDEKALAGKWMFIGCGAKDVHLKDARAAKNYYRSVGVRVFYEVWPDTGHRMDTSSGKLLEWLLALGPLGRVKSDLASARLAEKAGKLGKAYKIFLQIADISKKHQACIAAKEAGEKIAKKAEKQLTEAEKVVSDKNYSQAVKLLTRMTAAYEGSKFAQQAEEKLEALRADPAISDAIAKAELNARAGALEARAKAAEKEKDYKKAIELYERCVKECEGAGNYEAVKTRLAELKADKTIASAIEDNKAVRQCKAWLAMAQNYMQAGKNEAAVPYLKKVIERYGNTRYAEQAKVLLETIKSKKQ